MIKKNYNKPTDQGKELPFSHSFSTTWWAEVTATNYAFSKLRWSMRAPSELRRSKKVEVEIKKEEYCYEVIKQNSEYFFASFATPR
jgi:hypothetical protein